MPVTTQTYRPTLTSGQVYLRVAGSAAPLRAIGNVTQLDLAISEDEKAVTDYTTPGGGTWSSVSRINDVIATMILTDLDPINLARAVYGSETDTAVTVVTAELHGAVQGGLVRLAHPIDTTKTVTVKYGTDATIATATATGVAMTDYEVRPEGIVILGGAIGIANTSDAIKVSYTSSAYSAIEALTTGSQVFELSFGGLNEANSNTPVILDIYKLKLSAAKSLGMITTDFANLELTGKVLMDSTKTGGVSKYFKVSMV